MKDSQMFLPCFVPQHTEGFKKRWFTMDDRRLMYFKDPLVLKLHITAVPFSLQCINLSNKQIEQFIKKKCGDTGMTTDHPTTVHSRNLWCLSRQNSNIPFRNAV